MYLPIRSKPPVADAVGPAYMQRGKQEIGGRENENDIHAAKIHMNYCQIIHEVLGVVYTRLPHHWRGASTPGP